jgi:RNA polymerase primary sigma factor
MSNTRRIRKTGENALTTYFKEINKIAILTRSEEYALALRAREGDAVAREKIIQANLRFVINVAKKFHSRGLPLEDLVSEGNIGLIIALDHFNPEKGYRFISYAVWWIRQTILKAIGEKSRMIRLPQNKTQELLQIAKVREELLGELRAGPEADAIAQRLHCDRKSVAELLAISRDLLSLDAPVTIDDDVSSLEDFIEDGREIQPDQILVNGSLLEDVNRVMASLSQRESEILQSRFGLNGRTPLTLNAIGRMCKLTKERVRQIEKGALKRLRHPSQSRLLRAYT